ncbi:Zn-dependent hydrolase [Micromonospora sp. NBC_01655]|uniref:Zn-dependent hydrolase n=1 Tax=Micromonospora sp. NBC_01655 TaxID=2975983 RepID=UPI00224F80F8|nr:Zn-dependent hydrolase [Micromonospora sp. NBC_01655]MCX4472505.1 Zn-dependent hydrolase [Micromonospora sp. NBC_01655]
MSPTLVETSLPPVDTGRLTHLLTEFAGYSETTHGVTRLAYTPLERGAHRMFTDELSALGLHTWTDAAGNSYAEIAGGGPARAIGTGSHLDTVPNAGRFDGIAGVVAAMEVARILVESDARHTHPIRFVAFAGEEGARFGQACTGSRIAAGLLDSPDLADLRDTRGVSVADAMRSVGLDPDRVSEARWSTDDWAAFVELHIEQGNVLEAQAIPVGIVELISGSTRLRLDLHGRASHTGGTPMHQRADAMTAAAEITLLAEEIATDARHHGTRATVGRLELEPGSITTIPGTARLYVDIRDVDSDRQRLTAVELINGARSICERRGLTLDIETLGDTSPVVLPVWLRRKIADVCTTTGTRYRVLPSGASHDSQMINKVVPAGMIFVPSRNGLSHVPDEWTSVEDLAVGTDLLARSLLALDRELDSGTTAEATC